MEGLKRGEPLKVVNEILSIDLVRVALRSADTLDGCTGADLQGASDRYTRFFTLCAKYPDRPLAPTRDINLMWHLHTLNPRAYFKDCQCLFGDILDHDGEFGLTDEERPEFERIFGETARLWYQEFGEPYTSERGGTLKQYGTRYVPLSPPCIKSIYG